jgi:hypothetical protein
MWFIFLTSAGRRAYRSIRGNQPIEPCASRADGGAGEQVMLNRVRDRSDSDRPGCGGLEPDHRLAKDIRSSTAILCTVLVAISHASAGASPER